MSGPLEPIWSFGGGKFGWGVEHICLGANPLQIEICQPVPGHSRLHHKCRKLSFINHICHFQERLAYLLLLIDFRMGLHQQPDHQLYGCCTIHPPYGYRDTDEWSRTFHPWFGIDSARHDCHWYKTKIASFVKPTIVSSMGLNKQRTYPAGIANWENWWWKGVESA